MPEQNRCRTSSISNERRGATKGLEKVHRGGRLTRPLAPSTYFTCILVVVAHDNILPYGAVLRGRRTVGRDDDAHVDVRTHGRHERGARCFPGRGPYGNAQIGARRPPCNSYGFLDQVMRERAQRGRAYDPHAQCTGSQKACDQHELGITRCERVNTDFTGAKNRSLQVGPALAFYYWSYTVHAIMKDGTVHKTAERWTITPEQALCWKRRNA